jgi:hypothetical protein
MHRERVKILAACEVDEERLPADTTAHLAESTADELVRVGNARYTHEVQLLQPLLVGLVFKGVGSTVAVSSRRALDWHRTGIARLLDPMALGNPAPPDDREPTPPDPLASDPRIAVRILEPKGQKRTDRGVFIGDRTYLPGQEAELAERLAVRLLHARCAELAKGQQLTQAGRHYLDALAGNAANAAEAYS